MSGEISSNASYTLSELSKRTGLKRDALRSARRKGLRVVYLHNRGYVLGRDWLLYLDEQGSAAESQSEINDCCCKCREQVSQGNRCFDDMGNVYCPACDSEGHIVDGCDE